MHSNHTTEGAPSASIPEREDPLSAARTLIAQDAQQRMECCAAEIEQVLAKWGMRLETTPARVMLAPNPSPEVTG